MRYDLAVIGTGPGGLGAAIQAAKLGKRVAAIEKMAVVGGNSVNTGTIPSKTFREAVLFFTGYYQRGLYGFSYTMKDHVSIQDLTYRCQQVVQDRGHVVKSQFARNGVSLLFGEASFMDSRHVRVRAPDGAAEIIEADYTVVSTGSLPAHSPKVPINGSTIVDSDGILKINKIPKNLIVVGAGAVGVEYASFFAALGAKVTLVDMRQHVLEFLDREIFQGLCYELRQNGVTFRLGEEVTEVVTEGCGVLARTRSNKTIRGDLLLYAVGRVGSTAGLGLESLGIAVDARQRIPVNDSYQTVAPNVYAVGDVIGPPALTATSREQGRRAVHHALGIPIRTSTELLPIGIYSIPELSMVGKTEEELTESQVPYECGVARYRETARGKIIGDTSGMMKLLFHAENRQLLGVHVIGERSPELVHIGQVAMAMGATLDFFVENVFNYPTLAECYKVAALDAYNKLGDGASAAKEVVSAKKAP
ncbi:MAG: Si-specific NAD(P)(+) transhydrogenase [SAR202 cluster bacterium]|nr:Si-specific NAD(P)(+) transhydrogenase [SAR202 cluster bacterium]